MDVLVKVVSIITRVFPFLINLPYETPNRQIIIIHLKVVVFTNSGPKIRHFFFCKCLLANRQRVLVLLELELIRSTNQPIPIQYFTQCFFLLFQMIYKLNIKQFKTPKRKYLKMQTSSKFASSKVKYWVILTTDKKISCGNLASKLAAVMQCCITRPSNLDWMVHVFFI